MKQKIVNGEYGPNDAVAIEELFNSQITRSPFVFNIETTNYCNMTCVMCQRTTDFHRPLSHMSLETFNSIVNQMQPLPPHDFDNWQHFVRERLRTSTPPSENNFYFDIVARSVTLHGFGEPLLDPYLPQRVAALSQKKISSYCSCNPCNIRLDFIKKLFEAGLGHIKFAIDSLDDVRARQIRGKRADFTRSYQNVLGVLKLKGEMNARTEIILTMLDFTGDFGPESEARRFMNLWEGLDVYAYVKTVDNKWLLDKKGKKEELKGQGKSHYTKQYCEFPWTSITILADGSVVPCTQDINGLWTFGNVKEQSLIDIWNSPKYQEFRHLHTAGKFSPNFMCHAKCDLKLAAYYLGTANEN
jgi:radical SAM protein with 4Fe4S-binding SPASM domain